MNTFLISLFCTTTVVFYIKMRKYRKLADETIDQVLVWKRIAEMKEELIDDTKDRQN
jgi:hypothetical protein